MGDHSFGLPDDQPILWSAALMSGVSAANRVATPKAPLTSASKTESSGVGEAEASGSVALVRLEAGPLWSAAYRCPEVVGDVGFGGVRGHPFLLSPDGGG